MKRRSFLILGSLIGLSSTIKAKSPDSFGKSFKEVEATIRAVQEHMFPSGTELPSAREMNVTKFLFETISDRTYDKDIRAFVIEGAKELQVREKGRFASMSPREKEKALRRYEESSYGQNWLSRILTLTMEGMFGDPVYGSNVKEYGWKALHAFGGQPRPKNRYIEL
ncbi:gluconate 2-dehydrogenase subunit 3 family protein [Sulfurovum sp.]|uniref:gluconate 2-dehydrogenase subunit 3 family protein n=1 Tax=Sulfurovum sp. TaxID=1969726 RepID=UPI0025F2C60D|nr:gluconate 2-dehydrogenase subunit 3 family protein [Sulfurovum sp.]